MLKRLTTSAKQWSLRLFEHQIRFLPMTASEQKQAVDSQRDGLGIAEKSETTKPK